MTYRRAVEPEERGGQSLALGDGLTVPGAHNLDRQPFRLLEVVRPENLSSRQFNDPVLRGSDALTRRLNHHRPIELDAACCHAHECLVVERADLQHVSGCARAGIKQLQRRWQAASAWIIDGRHQAEVHFVVSPGA